MKSVVLQLPDEVNEKEVKIMVAVILFEKGVFSSGQAAAFAGITKREFIETIGTYGVSIFNESASDLNNNPFD